MIGLSKHRRQHWLVIFHFACATIGTSCSFFCTTATVVRTTDVTSSVRFSLFLLFSRLFFHFFLNAVLIRKLFLLFRFFFFFIEPLVFKICTEKKVFDKQMWCHYNIWPCVYAQCVCMCVCVGIDYAHASASCTDLVFNRWQCFFFCSRPLEELLQMF